MHVGVTRTYAAAELLSVVAVNHRQGVLAFKYCVAYTVANPITLQPTPAGKALAQALAAADAGQTPRTVLPVLLASSRAPVVSDFSQGEPSSIRIVDLLQLQCLQPCEAARSLQTMSAQSTYILRSQPSICACGHIIPVHASFIHCSKAIVILHSSWMH